MAPLFEFGIKPAGPRAHDTSVALSGLLRMWGSRCRPKGAGPPEDEGRWFRISDLVHKTPRRRLRLGHTEPSTVEAILCHVLDDKKQRFEVAVIVDESTGRLARPADLKPTPVEGFSTGAFYLIRAVGGHHGNHGDECRTSAAIPLQVAEKVVAIYHRTTSSAIMGILQRGIRSEGAGAGTRREVMFSPVSALDRRGGMFRGRERAGYDSEATVLLHPLLKALGDEVRVVGNSVIAVTTRSPPSLI